MVYYLRKGKKKEKGRYKMDCNSWYLLFGISLLIYLGCVWLDFNFGILLCFVGDLGGSSGQDEVGGDDDSKNHAGLPNSPSSSGGFRHLLQKDWSM